jgi:50S ribosomal protein L16 3-hydroxylase
VSAGDFKLDLKFDKETFLAQHWQRKPLLIRNAIAGFTPPVSADELAGLAMEESVESRIIDTNQGQWQLQHGPFEDDDFRREGPWTLLVQAVDHYVPEVAQLRKLVDFLPQWRVDDVMMSYAVDGGSVGPHFDNYDVFLLQAEGERLWQLGQFCDAQTALLPHDELRILDQFDCTQEYLLGPGDVLYVPPGIAHWGTARGECTTFSIGFRAPRINDMVSRWADQLLEQLDDQLFYSDSHMEPVTRPGEIRPRDLQRALAQLQAALDRETGNHWFGELVTEPRYTDTVDEEELALARSQLQEQPIAVALSPAAKLAWQQEAGAIVVFANGESRQYSESVLPWLSSLCEHWRLEGEAVARGMNNADTAALLGYLLDSGCIYVD